MRNAYLSREEGMNHACLVQLMLYTVVYITIAYLFVKFIMKNTKKNLKIFKKLSFVLKYINLGFFIYL